MLHITQRWVPKGCRNFDLRRWHLPRRIYLFDLNAKLRANSKFHAKEISFNLLTAATTNEFTAIMRIKYPSPPTSQSSVEMNWIYPAHIRIRALSDETQHTPHTHTANGSQTAVLHDVQHATSNKLRYLKIQNFTIDRHLCWMLQCCMPDGSDRMCNVHVTPCCPFLFISPEKWTNEKRKYKITICITWTCTCSTWIDSHKFPFEEQAEDESKIEKEENII